MKIIVVNRTTSDITDTKDKYNGNEVIFKTYVHDSNNNIIHENFLSCDIIFLHTSYDFYKILLEDPRYSSVIISITGENYNEKYPIYTIFKMYSKSAVDELNWKNVCPNKKYKRDELIELLTPDYTRFHYIMAIAMLCSTHIGLINHPILNKDESLMEKLKSKSGWLNVFPFKDSVSILDRLNKELDELKKYEIVGEKASLINILNHIWVYRDTPVSNEIVIAAHDFLKTNKLYVT